MYEEILCITHKYPPFTGGMEKQSYELIQGLSSYYRVHIIAFEGKENKLLWFLKLKSRVKKLLKANPNIKLIHLNDGAMGVAVLWLQKITQIPVVVTYHGLDITYPLTFFQKKLIPKLIKYKGAVCVSKFTSEQCIKRGFDPRTTFIVNNGVALKLNEIPFD
jgi:phosphatidylinositol alpha-1,6-mannosyltransferase